MMFKGMILNVPSTVMDVVFEVELADAGTAGGSIAPKLKIDRSCWGCMGSS